MIWIYGDNVDTDVIIPARYLNTKDAVELSKHCMEDIDSSFSKNVKSGDIIVSGENFGCGSSREHAPLAIKTCGIKAVIAKSFARIFYRNAINIGLVIIENSEIQNNVYKDDVIEFDLNKGILYNRTKGDEYSFVPYPAEIRNLVNAGGLVEYTKRKLGL